MATGVWPNGTQIAKEFTPAHPAEAGEPVSESHYNGLGMIIKDTERYTAETGYLGFFQFGHHPEPYSTTAELMPREVCSTCHEASAGDQQNIFADHHIGLKR
ncbi:cytochrome P460 [Roseibium sp. TrichSKD4]|uniref:cytochrome P460 family protein n=1 Tax=Roseibium sp. TrichSKD4 TaxID=744980 RepID=UPI0001E56E16|nr:cytochrome P460 family protein [Roseibium sp. TrichSKD4]EFO31553.1 cytochrome P460 [Roseibium sp. TrichSKD4]